MNIRVCDICGKEIKPGHWHGIAFHDDKDPAANCWDICERCYTAVTDFVDNGCRDLWQQDHYELKINDLQKQIEKLTRESEEYQRYWMSHVTGDPWYEGPDTEPQHDIPTSTEKPRRAACKRSHGASWED